MCVRGIFPKLSIIPKFLPITPHLAQFSIESLFFDTKTVLPSPKNSFMPLVEMDCSFSICSHYSFSLFIASGLQNEKRQHLNFFVRSILGIYVVCSWALGYCWHMLGKIIVIKQTDVPSREQQHNWNRALHSPTGWLCVLRSQLVSGVIVHLDRTHDYDRWLDPDEECKKQCCALSTPHPLPVLSETGGDQIWEPQTHACIWRTGMCAWICWRTN